MDSSKGPLEVPAARTGRRSQAARIYKPGELVRVEVRMPAEVAADLFARAREAGQPVSRTASELLAKALDDTKPEGVGGWRD
jgi:post-segregation antitoxin (ccd killing protein)